VLVAFGGAGGLHACALAQSLGIPKVMVPQLPGALSAYGILVSDVVKDYSRTVLMRVAPTAQKKSPRRTHEGTEELIKVFGELERTALRDFTREKWEGKPRFARAGDVRYRGQGFELNVPYGPSVVDDFHAEHKRRYGYSHPEREVEIVTVRLRATLPAPKVKLAREIAATREPEETKGVWFDGKRQPTKIFAREALRSGKRYTGPAIVTEYSATTVVHPRMKFFIDGAGALVIDVRG
jgi:N-methylhydantoinase A